ncbi:MAG: SGNH/GDSL hydrolase family protein [Arcicella sp.]|nr:SGNH/GDSL hydrolase family protein [Arcicella sp.]
MKKLLLFTTLIWSMTSFIQDKPKKVIFFGDSITQAGVQPKGYITMISQLLEKQVIKDKYELIGAGVSGNKVYDLFLRLEDDVLMKKPDLVFIYIGVNDVWHKSTHGTGTDPDKFVKFYQAIINKIQANGAKVVLCTPAAIGERTDSSNQQDGDMNNYSNLIRGIAQKNNLKLVDLRKDFLDYNLKNNLKNEEKGILTTDRVHLNDLGNQFVANKMLPFIVE